MKKVLLIMLLLGISSQSFAQQNASLLSALVGSKEEIEVSPNLTITETNTIAPAETMVAGATCAEVKQTSLPLNLVMGLLRGKGATLTPSHNASTGTLNIFGGPMIANCNSMLDFVLHPKKKGQPYSFEVRVKSCGSSECEYKVSSMVNDEIKTSSHKFEPTMKGFISCLEKTGVFKDGKINKDSIVKANFDVDMNGIAESGKLLFVSKGPAFNNMSKVFSKKNKLKNDECYFYENIQEKTFRMYSKKDLKEQILLDKANRLCHEADHEKIYNNLDSFTKIAGTYYQLENVMKIELLKELKEAKKEFDKAVEKGDLGKLDTDKYGTLFDNFYKMVIQKHFDEKSHNSADKKNPNLLVNLKKAFKKAKTKEEKDRIEKKIRDLSAKLAKYMQKPYFTGSDYSKFISLVKKAPIKDPMWKKATLNMHKSVISLKVACQAHAVNTSSCGLSKNHGVEDMMEMDDLNDVIEGYAEIAQGQYQKRETVLKNPNDRNSEFFADKIKECDDLNTKVTNGIAQWRTVERQAHAQAQVSCQRRNQYAGQYGGWYQQRLNSCIEDLVQSEKEKYVLSGREGRRLKVCNSHLSSYKKQYKEWLKLEKQSESYAEVKEAKKKKKPETDDKPSVSSDLPLRYNPNYGPLQANTPNYNNFQNFNQRPQFNNYMPQQNYFNGYNNRFNQGFYPQFNSGFNFGLGYQPFNGGNNFYPGYQGYQGYQAPGQFQYLRQPSGVYNYNGGGNLYNFLPQQTSPYGQFNLMYR